MHGQYTRNTDSQVLVKKKPSLDCHGEIWKEKLKVK